MSMVVRRTEMLRDEFGAAVVLVAHTGKDQSAGVRGHSSIHGGNDVEILVKDKVATIAKSRDGEESIEFPFRLKVVELGVDSEGDMQKTCVVEHLDDAPKRRKKATLSNTETNALKALELMADPGKLPLSTAYPEGVRGCTLEQWKTEYYRTAGLEDKYQRQYFHKAKNGLQAKGRIGILDEFVWIE